MTPLFPGSVTSDGNENCSTTSYQIGPNFCRAHDLHWSRGPNSAQWSPLGLRQFYKETQQLFSNQLIFLSYLFILEL